MLLDTKSNKEKLLNNDLIDQSIKNQFNTDELKLLSKLDILSLQESIKTQNINHLVNQAQDNWELENSDSSLETLELLRKKKEQLEKSWAKQKQLINKQQKFKKVVIGASIGGALIAGISAGLGSYFGLRNINSKINNKIKKLKEQLLFEKETWKQINKKDSLYEIFTKLLKIAFEKDLPKAIFEVIDKSILKIILKDYITSESSDELKKILNKSIKDKTKELIDKLLTKIRDITLKIENDDEDEEQEENEINGIIEKIQKEISTLVKDYVPDFIEGTINFLVKIDNSDTGNRKGKSIIALLIEKILKNNF